MHLVSSSHPCTLSATESLSHWLLHCTPIKLYSSFGMLWKPDPVQWMATSRRCGFRQGLSKILNHICPATFQEVPLRSFEMLLRCLWWGHAPCKTWTHSFSLFAYGSDNLSSTDVGNGTLATATFEPWKLRKFWKLRGVDSFGFVGLLVCWFDDGMFVKMLAFM